MIAFGAVDGWLADLGDVSSTQISPEDYVTSLNVTGLVSAIGVMAIGASLPDHIQIQIAIVVNCPHGVLRTLIILVNGSQAVFHDAGSLVLEGVFRT